MIYFFLCMEMALWYSLCIGHRQGRECKERRTLPAAGFLVASAAASSSANRRASAFLAWVSALDDSSAAFLFCALDFLPSPALAVLVEQEPGASDQRIHWTSV